MARQVSAPFRAGYARMAAWSDLLDDINVFPIADGDTGRNLSISLAPLKALNEYPIEIVGQNVLRQATGNSGNIAAAFIMEFLKGAETAAFARAAANGAHAARSAIANPVSGTMLDVFDSLAERLAGPPAGSARPDQLLPALADAVQATTARLPALAAADLIDAGALAMYLFFEGFFFELDGREPLPGPLPAVFGHLLRTSDRPRTAPASADSADEICVNALVRPAAGSDPADLQSRLQRLGESVVTLGSAGVLKIHLHARDLGAAAELLAGIGTIEAMSDEALYDPAYAVDPLSPGPIHIMTDAAGSLSRPRARQLRVTLLDSFVVGDGAAVPETLLAPEIVYRRMRNGERYTTAQASNRERHQRYAAALNRFQQVLYLSVGSAYTGNVAAARRWQRSNDVAERLTILDTGAASGRLGLIAQAVARYASRANTAEAVIDFAKTAVADCGELVFLDQLKYLAAGGRISKSRGFFGDLFKIKPVITPTPTGVKKVAVARNADRQLPLALAHLKRILSKAPDPLLLLQYTDNRNRVENEIGPVLAERFPHAEIQLTPLSLTAGVHMGPGTWAVAWLADGAGGT